MGTIAIINASSSRKYRERIKFAWSIAIILFLLQISSGTCLLSGTPRFGAKHNRLHARLQSSSLSDDVTTGTNGSQGNEEDDEQVQQRHLRFSGTGRLFVRNENAAELGQGELDPHLVIVELLTRSTVVILGLGGVGSWAAEALCRSGVGNLILIDLDDICISNTNRQLHATSSSVGRFKIEEMKKRLIGINPQCNVTNIHEFVSIDNVRDVIGSLLPEVSACLDAIDGTKEKAALVAACVEKRIPVVTVGGAAGRVDPTKIVCDDLTLVDNDRLLRSVRKSLRQQYGFAQGLPMRERQRGRKSRKWNIQAVYSMETPKELPVGEDASSLRRCDGALGTACFVTGTYGFVAASKVVHMIASNKPMLPRSK